MRKTILIAAVVAGISAPAAAAQAFCGFYVSGAGADLFNNATQVVMMRQGTRTVLSMQNNYQGPTTDFAMVVPVPVVLKKENVKTLPREIFKKIDQLSAPRLVEYWEQDPCRPPAPPMPMSAAAGVTAGTREMRTMKAEDLGVKVEAKFTVGEYQIVILSAVEATGLDTWLRREKYTIPEGAAPYLKPYVASGSKFFVAKVDVEKVKFENGQALLSPLRFHYDTDDFSLPIRLGMMNSAGTQDLIVHVLAPGQRYQVANYKNVTIPTNLDVVEEARERFGEFYAALFDRTMEKNPGSVVTEYSWDAGSCDPCPIPALVPDELATLGGDVLGQAGTGKGTASRSVPQMPMAGNFVLTRLHARYAKDGISEDLVFKVAPPITGGREWRGAEGKLEEGAIEGGINNFQARYAIRHPWTGPIACASPVRGVWGGPPDGQTATAVKPATDLAFVPRGKAKLATLVMQDVPEIGLTADASAAAPAKDPAVVDPAVVDPATVEPVGPAAGEAEDKPRREKKGCAAGGSESGGSALLVLFGLLLGLRARALKGGTAGRTKSHPASADARAREGATHA